MKRVSKLIISLFVCIALLIGGSMNIDAGGLWASASTSSVSVGSSFSVTVGASGVFVEHLSVSCSGCTLTSGIGLSTIDRGETQTVTAILNSSSGATVYFSGDGVDYNNEDVEVPFYTSASVSAYTAPSGGGNWTAPTGPTPQVDPEDDPRSSDNDLATLSVSAGKLSPEFSKDVMEYKVDLPSSTKSIKVDAKANDEKASVSGTGEIKLDAGDNEINITVTAENETKKVYKVNAYVDEKPLLYTTYNKQKLGVVRSIKNVSVPSGFKELKTKLDGKEIVAWRNDTIKKTIVYLVDEKGNKNFYLFEDGKVTSIFIPKQLLGKNLYLIDVPEETQKKEGMKYQKLKIDGNDLMGWTFEKSDFKNFQIIYVMDTDGKTRYYQYETEQKNLQVYSGAAPITQKEYEKQLHAVTTQKRIWMGIGIAALLVAISSIGYVIHTKSRSKK